MLIHIIIGRVSQNWGGYLSWGLQNQEQNIVRSVVGSLCFWTLPVLMRRIGVEGLWLKAGCEGLGFRGAWYRLRES